MGDVHLLLNWQTGRLACPTREPTPSATPDRSRVTCARCLQQDQAPVIPVGALQTGLTAQDLRRMSKTEGRYVVEVLIPALQAGTILDWGYETLTLRLAPRVTYTPDFVVWSHSGIDLHEIKGAKVTNGRVHGYWQGDAAVKFRLARAWWHGGTVQAWCPRPTRLGGGWQELFVEGDPDPTARNLERPLS